MTSMRDSRDGLSRRELLRTAGFVGAGSVALLATGPSVADAVSAAATPSYQTGWRFCSVCRCLYWPTSGQFCFPRQGSHVPSGYTYTMLTTASGLTGQSGWCFCAECHELYYGYMSGGCPRIDGVVVNHSLFAGRTYDYVMAHVPAGSNVVQTVVGFRPQIGWRYCVGCHALVWGSNLPGDNICPSPPDLQGVSHVLRGYTYVMYY